MDTNGTNEMATEKQIGYLRTLIDEREITPVTLMKGINLTTLSRTYGIINKGELTDGQKDLVRQTWRDGLRNWDRALPELTKKQASILIDAIQRDGIAYVWAIINKAALRAATTTKRDYNNERGFVHPLS